MLNIPMGRPFKSAPVCALLLGMLISTLPASAQFRRNTNNGVVLYRDPNFTGPSRTIRTDVADLRPYGLNDMASSIEIPPGETWEVCQDVNYENQCQVLSASVADLRRSGWTDRISSLRRVNDRGFGDRRTGTGGVFQNSAQRGLLFFDRDDFRGTSTPVTGVLKATVYETLEAFVIGADGVVRLIDSTDGFVCKML